MCAQVHYTKDLFTLVLFSPMENKLSQFCKSCHKDVLFIFLFIAICFWQWFTVHGLRETAQNLLANQVWIFIACDPWTPQIGEALKLWAPDTINTRVLKDNGGCILFAPSFLTSLPVHTPSVSHNTCLQMNSRSFFYLQKLKQKTDRQAQDGETWMECKCGKVCISSVYHKGSFSPVDCFKQVSRTDSKSLFILGSSLSGIRQRKNYFIWQP